MPRNTYLLVLVLAIFAALVAGVNLTQKIFPANPAPSPEPSRPSMPSEKNTSAPAFIPYQNPYCGITFSYPDSFTRIDNNVSSQSASFINSLDKSSLFVLCQPSINTKIPSTAKKFTITLPFEPPSDSSVSATVYIDQVDSKETKYVKFTPPATQMETIITSNSNDFDSVLDTLAVIGLPAITPTTTKQSIEVTEEEIRNELKKYGLDENLLKE